MAVNSVKYSNAKVPELRGTSISGIQYVWLDMSHLECLWVTSTYFLKPFCQSSWRSPQEFSSLIIILAHKNSFFHSTVDDQKSLENGASNNIPNLDPKQFKTPFPSLLSKLIRHWKCIVPFKEDCCPITCLPFEDLRQPVAFCNASGVWIRRSSNVATKKTDQIHSPIREHFENLLH